MPDGHLDHGLRVPSVFWGLDNVPSITAALQALIAQLGDVTNPGSPWFAADNLITYGHSCGFLRDPHFVAAVHASRPSATERALAWRTHTLCWAAQSCLSVAGDFVECGTYQGYAAEVLLRYTNGLPGRSCHLYGLFEPIGGAAQTRRPGRGDIGLFARVEARFRLWPNVTVTRGAVPQVLDFTRPEQIAFLHLDMNNAEAEHGALEMLFDRITPGGAIVFDDYGWTGCVAQKCAADAFLQDRGLTVLELPTGQGIAIKR